MAQTPTYLSETPAKRFTLQDLRSLRAKGLKTPMLTCYDYTTARLMEQAGVECLLVGDSAGNVILGYPSTLPVKLDFLIELTAAVRRGAPNSFLVADMPFGSYQASTAKAIANVCRMVQLSGCDCVKLEVVASHAPLVKRLADAGVAIMAHVGLRPQNVGILGGYRAQGRTAQEALNIVQLCRQMESAGAAALLIEAVPPEVSAEVVRKCSIPVIGCGAGPACDGHVVVIQDALGLTPKAPKFVPVLGDLAKPIVQYLSDYVRMVRDGSYPSPQQCYEMPADEKSRLANLALPQH